MLNRQFAKRVGSRFVGCHATDGAVTVKIVEGYETGNGGAMIGVDAEGDLHVVRTYAGSPWRITDEERAAQR